jgi:hypothetical protein
MSKNRIRIQETIRTDDPVWIGAGLSHPTMVKNVEAAGIEGRNQKREVN